MQGTTMIKKAILLLSVLGVLQAGPAFATTGAKGSADRIALREGYAQYAGKIDLRDSTGAVIFYYWGGDRCAAAAVAPSERQIDKLLDAHIGGHEYQLDYTDVASAYGNSRCWDGGIQLW